MRLDDILDQVKSYAPNADTDVVVAAYMYAARAHAGQTRKSGEAYLVHPLAVAAILADMRMDVDTIATAMLHDTMEDCLATREELTREFSAEIAELVDGVTKIGKLEFRNKHEAQAENFRKLILAMARDIRVILVKLADRLHNMRTMKHMKPDRQRAISQETLDIYAPIANRLGLSRIKMELEDHCFEYLHPDVYADINDKIAAGADERQGYINRVSALLHERLREAGVECRVTGRPKHLFSIYRKMLSQNLSFEEIHDQLAFRVLVHDVAQCYTAFGFVHGMFRPFPDRIKDYIACPKSNGYQSLHTTVVGPEGRQIEIQIRTQAMHDIAENGIAAHWKYKEGHLALSRESMSKIIKLRELFEAAQEVDDPQEFLESVKIDLFSNEIFLFTPQGDVKFLPQGATPIDFAFAIHSEVGYHCSGARVNGRMVPLGTELQSGDTVEILTRPDQKPSRGWLELAATGRALSRIRRAIREDERERGRELGREMLEARLKEHGQALTKLVKSGRIEEVAREHGHRQPEQLYLAVGMGQLTIEKVLRDLLPPGTLEEEERAGIFSQIFKRLRKKAPQSPVLIHGEEDVLVTYARCCKPVPGEPVGGYVTRGRGITVHLLTCPQYLAAEEERRIPVEWHPDATAQHNCELELVTQDKPGMLAEISAACKTHKINITYITMHAIEDQKALCSLEVAVGDVSQLNRLMRDLERIRGVIRVERVRAQAQS